MSTENTRLALPMRYQVALDLAESEGCLIKITTLATAYSVLVTGNPTFSPRVRDALWSLRMTLQAAHGHCRGTATCDEALGIVFEPVARIPSGRWRTAVFELCSNHSVTALSATQWRRIGRTTIHVSRFTLPTLADDPRLVLVTLNQRKEPQTLDLGSASLYQLPSGQLRVGIVRPAKKGKT